MKRILVTKVLETGYGVGVMPEMEKPHWQLKENWEKFISSLPTFLVGPSSLTKEGEFIEQWREGWEIDEQHNGKWVQCNEAIYETELGQHRRIVIFPLVEKKEESFFKQIEGDLKSIVLAYPVHGKHPYYDMIGKVFEKVKKYNNEKSA